MTDDPIIKAALEAGLERCATNDGLKFHRGAANATAINGFIHRFAAIITVSKDARIAELEAEIQCLKEGEK